MELFKGNKAKTVNLLFQSLLVTYLILLLTEQIWQKSVSLYMNLNYLLIIVIVAGILDVFSEHEEQKDEKAKKRDYIFMAILGILGFIILKFKTADLGWLSWVISAVAGVLIVLLSMLILGNDEEISYEKEKISKIKWKTIVPLILVALVLISAGLGLFTSLGYLESFRIVFGSVYVLFLPGFIISFIFFPKTKEYGSEQESILFFAGCVNCINNHIWSNNIPSSGCKSYSSRNSYS